MIKKRVLSDRKRLASFGYTLVELMMVVAIASILSSISVTFYSRYIEKARCQRAILHIQSIEKEIATYYAITSKYPENLSDIGLGNVLDEWGNPYYYLRIQDSDDACGNNGGGQSARFGFPDFVFEFSDIAFDDVFSPSLASAGNANTEDGNAWNADAGNGNGGGNGGCGKGKQRRDRNMNPINTDYDLYSMGKDGNTSTQLNSAKSRDDIVRALNGEFIGLASDF